MPRVKRREWVDPEHPFNAPKIDEKAAFAEPKEEKRYEFERTSTGLYRVKGSNLPQSLRQRFTTELKVRQAITMELAKDG